MASSLSPRCQLQYAHWTEAIWRQLNKRGTPTRTPDAALFRPQSAAASCWSRSVPAGPTDGLTDGCTSTVCRATCETATNDVDASCYSNQSRLAVRLLPWRLLAVRLRLRPRDFSSDRSSPRHRIVASPPSIDRPPIEHRADMTQPTCRPCSQREIYTCE